MTSSELLPWDAGQVLKLFPAGTRGGAIEAELRNARAASALGIPTPRAERIIEIERGGPRRGIVFERCEGPTLLAALRSPGAPLERLAQLFFELQRGIHRCDGAAFPDLRERLAQKIRAARASEALKARALDTLERMPALERACHGDFHPGNVIMTASGPRVIDWGDAGRGDPAFDAARTLLLLECGAPSRAAPELRRGFAAAYRECLRLAWPTGYERIMAWTLPAALARLAEPVDATECESLLRLLNAAPSTIPAASRS